MGKKRARESEEGAAAEAAAAAQAAKREKRGRQLERVRAPSSLPRLEDGEELVLLRFPAGFDVAQLHGCALPEALLTDALGGGFTLQLRGGSVRVSSAPRGTAAQGMFVAVVEAAAGGGGGGGGGGGEDGDEGPAPAVSLLPTPVTAVLDLAAVVPPSEAIPGLRRVALQRRTPVAPVAVPKRA